MGRDRDRMGEERGRLERETEMGRDKGRKGGEGRLERQRWGRDRGRKVLVLTIFNEGTYLTFKSIFHKAIN